MTHTALEERSLILKADDTCIWMSEDKKVGVATVLDDMAMRWRSR